MMVGDLKKKCFKTSVLFFSKNKQLALYLGNNWSMFMFIYLNKYCSK